MPINRLFNILILIALVIVVGLTVREAFATASVVSLVDAKECDSLPSRYSLHTEAVDGTGLSLPYTEDGPTGLDGGMIQLLSDYRTCSK